MSTWHTYILRCADQSLYVGITTDLEARLLKHNAGKGGAYTRSHRPVRMVWHEEAVSESSARKREAELKKLKKARKEWLVQSAS
jgi:putative endonuclease